MTNKGVDFNGIYFYQWFVPVVTWSSIFGAALGPIYAPLYWLSLVRSFAVLYCAVGISQCLHLFRAFDALNSEIFRSVSPTRPVPELDLEAIHGCRADNLLETHFSTEISLYHLIVLPNYNESVELLETTLKCLAEHPRAKTRYVVVLAMEAAEEQYEGKAKLLVAKFGSSFHLIFYTVHLKGPDELGVAANTNSAVRQAAAHLADTGYGTDEVIVTKIDADAEVPSLYLDALEREFRHAKDPFGMVFAPPVLFERNSDKVPRITRVMDFVWSALAWQQLHSDVGLPLSNFSISLQLLQEIEFLDTNAVSIAEDAHLFLKAFFKTRGRARLRGIFVPLNMACVKSREGAWWSDVRARFVQAERHFRGVNEMAYALKQTARCGLLGWRHARLLARVAEATLLPGLVPTYFVVSVASAGAWLSLGGGSAELWAALASTAVLANALPPIMALLWLAFHRIRSLSRRELFGLPPEWMETH